MEKCLETDFEQSDMKNFIVFQSLFDGLLLNSNAFYLRLLLKTFLRQISSDAFRSSLFRDEISLILGENIDLLQKR